MPSCPPLSEPRLKRMYYVRREQGDPEGRRYIVVASARTATSRIKFGILPSRKVTERRACRNALWVSRPERRLLAGRHAFLRHGEQHGDGHIGAGHRRQVDHLLLAEQCPGTRECLV